MRHQSLTIFFLGLSLLSCDKPKSPGSTNHNPAPSSQSAQRRLTARESASESSQSFHERITYAETLDPGERDNELAVIAWNAMELDPSAAQEAYAKLTPGSVKKIRLNQHYALRLAEQDIDQAIEWALALESEKEISAALCHIAVFLAESDPRRAAHLLSESAMPGHDFDVAVVQVIQRWAAKSPPEAAAWVAQFPQGESRKAGLTYIAERWLPLYAPAAFAWLENIEDSSLRQEAARAMEGTILQQPEATRAAWLQHANESIQKELEQQRENALKDVGDNVPINAPQSDQ